MALNRNRILTTHVGSLIRADAIIRLGRSLASISIRLCLRSKRNSALIRALSC